MSTNDPPIAPGALRGDPRLKQHLQALCQADNLTNLLYVARAWLVIAVAIGIAVWWAETARHCLRLPVSKREFLGKLARPILLVDLVRYAAVRECVVENYLVPAPDGPERRPTVVEALGPQYARTGREDVWLDHTVLDAWQIVQKNAILEECRLSAAQRQG